MNKGVRILLATWVGGLKDTRGGGKSSEPEVVAVIPIYCET